MKILELLGLLFAATFLGWLVSQALHRIIRRVTVYDYQVGLLYRKGRLQRTLNSGVYTVCPFWSSVEILDTRKTLMTVSGQEVVTADKIGLKLSLVYFYQVVDPIKAIQGSTSYSNELYAQVQVALRKLVSSYAMDDVLAKRQQIGEELLAQVQAMATNIGLIVEQVDVKDVMFPGDIKKIYADTVKAQKEGLALLERARGETAALRKLANAAKMLNDNPALLNIRLLQTLDGGKESGRNTLVLGMPHGGLIPMNTTQRSDLP